MLGAIDGGITGWLGDVMTTEVAGASGGEFDLWTNYGSPEFLDVIKGM